MTDSIRVHPPAHSIVDSSIAQLFDSASTQQQRSPSQPLTPITNSGGNASIATNTHPPRSLLIDSAATGMSDSNGDASASGAPSNGRRSGRAKASVNYNEQVMEDVSATVAVIEASKEKEKRKPKKEKKDSTAVAAAVEPVTSASNPCNAPSTAFSIANFFSPKSNQKPISAPSPAESKAQLSAQPVASSAVDDAVVVEDTSAESKARSTTSANVPTEDLTEETKVSPSKKRKASTKKGSTANSPSKPQPPSTPPSKKQAVSSPEASTTPVPAQSVTPSAAGSGDDISEPIVLVSPPAAAVTASVDLTNDTNSPELAPKKSDSSALSAAASISKALHPFFMKPAKKEKPIPAVPEEPLSAAVSTSPLINPTSPPISSTPQSSSSATPPFTPIAPVKCELDSLYSTLPKNEFFMTRKEKTVVRSVKREKEFAQEIERDKAERLKIIQSYEASGKKIHPFLQPKASIVRAPTAQTGAGKAGLKEYSQFAGVQFTTDSSSMPYFPTEFSHVPLDFENHVAAAEGTLPPLVKVSFGSLEGFLHIHDGKDRQFKKQDPAHEDARIQHRRYMDLLNDFARFQAAAHQPLPRSLPLWIRPFGYATVNYLSAPAYRSSDISVYLGQSKVQNYLKDLVEKLKVIFSRSGQSSSPWSLETATKQIRKMLIRRLHCFRAMQRDEQLRARRSAERAIDEAGASTTTANAATSRSDRAAQRHNKSEVAEVEAHGDEQINHGFQPRPDSLWTEQYRAFRSEEMFAGNMQQRAQVRDWLQSWSLRQNDATPPVAPAASIGTANAVAPAKRRKTKFVYHSDDSDFEDAYLPPPSVAQSLPPASSSPIELANTLLLVGPPVGKTSLIYACCHESDTGVIEISNSERRSQRDVLAKCEEATQSHRLAMKTMAAGSGPSIAHNVSPIKIKRTESPVKKKAAPAVVATVEKPKEAAKAKVPFNFFDSNSKKKAALSAAASKPPAFGAKSKEDESDDFLNDKPAVPASSPASKKPRMKDLFRLKTKSIQQAVKGMPEELPESDEEDKTASGGKKRKAAAAAAKDSTPAVAAGDFFANQSSFKKAKLNTVSTSGAAPTLDPLAPVTAISSQSTIVFEEIDNVFAAHDKKFLHAVRTLISNAKRPIILTCNSITEEMENILLNPTSAIGGINSNEGMAVIERIEFNQISPAELLPYVYFICMAEVGFHNSDLQQYALPSLEEIYALLQFFNGDIRKTLLNLQIRLNSLPLTQMIGAENILSQSTASNSSNSWASTVMKTMLNLPASKTKYQDVILSILGLLGSKEEIVRMFDVDYSDFALNPVSPLRSAEQLMTQKGSPRKNVQANGFDSHICSDWMLQSQVNTMIQAHQCDLQLFHLNYLQSYVHSLVTAPQQLAAQRKATAMENADATVLDSDSTSSSAWFDQLPVRLAILPVTAEQMFPIESIQLTPENLARLPALLAAVTFAAAPVVTETIAPVEPIQMDLEASSSVTPSGSASESAPSGSDEKPAVASADDEDMYEEENEEENDDATKPVGRTRRRKRISDNEDNDDANDDADMADADNDKEEEELGASKRETKAQRKVREAQEYAKAQQLRRLALQVHDQQKFLIREQLIAEEQARRLRLQQQPPQPSKFTAGSPHQRVLDVLLHAAEAADDLSAADVFSQPNHHTGVHSYRLLNRSHARYHPAIHPFTSSASRDYFPTYLENYINSSSWYSLEQQQQDAIETELEAIDRNDSKPDISRQLTLSASKESDRKKQSTFGTGDEYEVEDMILPAFDMTREMHASVDVHSMRCMQSTVASLAKEQPPKEMVASWAPILPKLPAMAVREVALTPPAALPTPAPISSPDNPIVIDSQDSALSSPLAPLPPVPATPQQLYLPSTDPVSAGTFGVQIVAPPSAMTPQERAKWGQLASQIWEESQCSHLFTSTAFLCDVLPHLRSLIFTALDVSKANAVSDATANDAEIAASLAEDGGRSSRRSTRAARASGGGTKLNRKSVIQQNCST